MKKKLTIIMTTVLSGALLAGCGNTAETNSTASSSAAASASLSGSVDTEALQGTVSDSATTEESVVPLTEDGYLSYYTASDYVTLGEYKGLEVKVPIVDVTDEDVQETLLSSYSSSFTATEVTDRTDVQLGDTANIDYVGKYADTLEAFDGGTDSGYDLVIGSGTFIPGFEDGLIGAEVGSTVDVNLTFPEDYGAEELAGVDVVFTVTINSISAPSYSEEEVTALGIEGVTDKESLLAYIKEDLIAQAEEENKETASSSALEMAYDNATFVEEFPEVLVDRFIADYEDTIEYYMQMYSYYYGVTYTSVDDYISQNFGIAAEEVETYKHDQAIEQLKYIFLERAIVDAEGIEITDEEIESELLDIATQAGYTDVDSFVEFYTTTYGRDVRELEAEQLTAEKAQDFLAENAVMVEVEASELEEEQAAEEASEDASTDSSAE
ncbi:MAG: trigger factor [Butyrivibrio sp.]|uniref:trigger factor n=1 Tax=Butyrivibrio sp. TaxID=28121 RepID=UPI0025FD2EDF|nr:trigger factor [Butyrivibrio sp.]MCR5770537.1 trigger factor [Butyrivibrio sp.]